MQEAPVRQASIELVSEVLSGGITKREELERLRKAMSVKHRLPGMLNNATILSHVPELKGSDTLALLTKKPARSASGIVVIPVMAPPYPCPVTCVYCPGGVRAGTPQAYTRDEPAAVMGALLKYDPYLQVSSKLRELASLGHDVTKVETILLGGTFLAFPERFQAKFVKGCYDGLNGALSSSLDEAQQLAERAPIRNVGLTIETRPDQCKEYHVDLMLTYGATKVEIGVQCLDDEVYRLVNRGHSIQDVMYAFRVAKDSAYKVTAHMMPGLPGMTPEKDLDGFNRLLQWEEFKPDMLKIYPTLVVESSELYSWYREGRYQPYDLESVVDLLCGVKSMMPRWIRIMRIQREIPAKSIVAGVNRGNLRELVRSEMERRGLRCQCIRCREVGLRELKGSVRIDPRYIELRHEHYRASGGQEVFLSYEDRVSESLIGFLRLRIPSETPHRPEIKEKPSALVRELHVYGRALPLSTRQSGSWQHRGYGRRLMNEAERMAREEFNCRRIIVISAVGTREYYTGLGYSRLGPYMAKDL